MLRLIKDIRDEVQRDTSQAAKDVACVLCLSFFPLRGFHNSFAESLLSLAFH